MSQLLDDIQVYRTVIGAGFTRPIGATSQDITAVIATAIILDKPGTTPATLWTSWSAHHDPKQLPGYRSAFVLNSADPVWQRANTAVIQAEVTYLGKDITEGLAKGIGQGMETIPKVADAVAAGLVDFGQKLDPLGGLLSFLTAPGGLLRVALVIGGGFLSIIGAYMVVERSGATDAATAVAGKVAQAVPLGRAAAVVGKATKGPKK